MAYKALSERIVYLAFKHDHVSISGFSNM